jgi:hypothetical protein
VRIIGIELIGNVDELPGLGLGRNGFYHYILTGHHIILQYLRLAVTLIAA